MGWGGSTEEQIKKNARYCHMILTWTLQHYQSFYCAVATKSYSFCKTCKSTRQHVFKLIFASKRWAHHSLSECSQCYTVYGVNPSKLKHFGHQLPEVLTLSQTQVDPKSGLRNPERSEMTGGLLPSLHLPALPRLSVCSTKENNLNNIITDHILIWICRILFL